VTGLERAAVAVGGIWLVVVLGPVASQKVPLVVGADARPILHFVGLAATALVVLRRQSFDTMSFRLES
jgi:Na+/H+ antiporter NhaD/arsenite permease-like protein